MRNKSTLVLIEHMVMLLVFALAAAVCLRMFALSGKLSRTYEATDRAVLAAQNAAEWIKQNGMEGFPEESGEFVVRVTGVEETEYLFRAEIVVLTDAGEELFRLPVAAQIRTEVAAYEED